MASQIPGNSIVCSKAYSIWHQREHQRSVLLSFVVWNPRVIHDDVIKWRHFPRYWPFVRGIHQSPVNSSHKGQCGGALMFSLICAWIKGWLKNCEAGYLRRHCVHYGVTVMRKIPFTTGHTMTSSCAIFSHVQYWAINQDVYPILCALLMKRHAFIQHYRYWLNQAVLNGQSGGRQMCPQDLHYTSVTVMLFTR